MKTAYDNNQPIETLYTHMNQAVDFSNASAILFTPSQIVVTAYNLVFNTGLYHYTYSEWRRCLPANKT